MNSNDGRPTIAETRRWTPPVLLLVFNRPAATARSFDAVRRCRPSRLFIAGDAARPDRPAEVERVLQVRAIVDRVDWPCEVQTLFRSTHLGCARSVSSAVEWALAESEEVVVLEDDCVPSSSFLPFCGELLERYRDDQRIFVISGDNFQTGSPRTGYSYYFSRYNHCWGWATWRRAWRHFDFDMRLWPELRSGNWLADILQDPRAERYWCAIFDRVTAGEIDSWAYRWTFACWVQSGLSVLPSVNLVQNIGIGTDATHTVDAATLVPAARELEFPLRHPPFVIRDAVADTTTQRLHFGTAGLFERLRRTLSWRR